MSKHHSKINRRAFLGQASCAALGYSTILSGLVSLKGMSALAMSNSTTVGAGDYKGLIALNLSGGNDSYNMLMPRGGTPLGEYQVTRSNLAINSTDMRPIMASNTPGREFGLHPSLERLSQLFNSGRAAFLSNVGTLVQPTDKPSIYNSSAKLPLGLLSHSDQGQQWQTGMPDVRSSFGWGGRIADLIRDMNTNQSISMNVSLSGTNIFQIGNQVVSYVVDPYNGAIHIEGYEPQEQWETLNFIRTDAINEMLDASYADIYKKAYVDVIKQSNAATRQFNAALESTPTFDDLFEDNYLSRQFQMIARIIAAKDVLEIKRQIFYIDYGGWDHHDDVLNQQLVMFGEVDRALNAFNLALERLGCEDDVVTFSISEFARTLTSNGNGTDHAWGGNVLMMGGAVDGQKIFGEYPTLALNSDLEIGNGILIPTTSCDEYFAELALWFGVSSTDLPLIFPNLSRFYDIQSGDAPIGFLNIT